MTDKTLPAPPVPEDCDLRGFGFMPLDVQRLRDSELAVSATGDEFRAAVMLWCAAWHQVPAGSVPDDDRTLSVLTGYGRTTTEWLKVKAGAMRGFYKCSDGRMYHPIVAEKAAEAWRERQEYRVRKEQRVAAAKAAADAKWGKQPGNADNQQDQDTRSQRLKAAKERGSHTTEQWETLLHACGSKCVRCGADTGIVKDHITPIHQGGSDAITNLQPLCRPCSSGKKPTEGDLRPSDAQALADRIAGINGQQNACDTQASSDASAGINLSEAQALDQAIAGNNASEPQAPKEPTASKTPAPTTPSVFTNACRKGEGQGEGEGQGVNPLLLHGASEASTTSAPVQKAAPLPAASRVVITMPATSGAEVPITEATWRELASLYPAVDVPQELRNMRGWLIANPTNRKTPSGMMRFVTNWLAKAQNNARPAGNNGSQGNRPPNLSERREATLSALMGKPNPTQENRNERDITGVATRVA